MTQFEGLNPEARFLPRLWPACTVRALWVTDDPIWGGFGTRMHFHLGEALRQLQPTPWSPVKLEITTAHRHPQGDGQITGIRFDAMDLSPYSQVWLFGIEPSAGSLSDAEVDALARFMNAGGGVFATGDHQNLGRAMASRVPRVRSMRRWHYPTSPYGEPIAPSQSGADRIDSIADTEPGAPGIQGEQTDALPQTIRPRMYSRAGGNGLFRLIVRYPHPVLCGPTGPIEFLPDHMHEGICEVPSDLTRTFVLDGVTCEEYPAIGPHRQSPEVIAWGTSNETEIDQFGVLAAYDGHAAGVGRVLVDSTWHHWFNINLWGLIHASDPGYPSYDPTVVPKWEAIKAFLRNVPLWLADPETQKCILATLWLSALTHVDVRITFKGREWASERVLYLWQLGSFVREALALLTTKCTMVHVVSNALSGIGLHIDPWDQGASARPPAPAWLDWTQFENVALGGAADRLLQAVVQQPAAPLIDPDTAAATLRLAREGAAAAATDFLRYYVASADDAQRLISIISA